MIATTSHPSRRSPLAVALLVLTTACSGGGGGGGSTNAKPTIVAASFVGTGPAPVAGDLLLLTFSEAISLVPERILTDADVALSDSATLGTITTAPTVLSSNALVIQLGAGVALAPTTTITLLDPANNTGNDVVRDATGQLGGGGTPVPIGASDGSSPTVGNVTIAAVDDELNGTGAAGGVLQVPAKGWTIDLAYADNGPIATTQTWITASVQVTTAGGSQPPGSNLLPFLTTLAAGNTTASYQVPATTTFPDGPLTLTVLVVDASGRASVPSTFAATVRAFSTTRQPFETATNASQVWFLDFSRDIESFTTSTQSGVLSVDVVAGGNGRSDFEDILRILGLNTAAPIANVENGLDSNQVVVARFQQALLAELTAFYAGANVSFTLTQPGGSFGSNPTVPYSSLGFSRIAIAGSADTVGVLGVAIFDPNNETQDDDTRTDFGGTRLGIFLHTIVDAGLGSSASTLFRLTYGQFTPALGGVAIGADANDGTRLTGANTDARADDIATAIADLARFCAVVTAHECGHSMGLVQNGAMPTGLYGDDSTNFPGSSDGHIRNTSLFPPGATNVMSPSLSYSSTIHPATAFNRLNLAYLREQVTYGN